MSRRGWLLFAALCVIWGLPYLFIRVAVEQVSPGTLVFLRTAGAALLLLPLAMARGQVRPVLVRWRAVIMFTLVEVMVPWLLLGDAERHVSSSLAGLLVAAVPMIGAILARFSSHGDPMNRAQLGGLVLGMVGVGCLVGLDIRHLNLFAIAEMALVSLGYAAGPLVLARSLSDLPGLGVIAVAMTASAIGYLPWAIIEPPGRLPGRAVLSIVVLAVICTALAFIVFFQLVAAIGPTRCTVITYVNPAVAILLGVSVLGERLTVGMLVGFPLILCGSVIAARKVQPMADLPVESAATAA